MPENHEHSRYIATQGTYDGHRRDINDLDLKAYIDERIAANPSPGGSGSLQSATVTLTDAQIKALPTTPVQIVAAPGAGKFINIINCNMILDVTAGVYTNLSAALLNIKRTGQNSLILDNDGAYLEDNTNPWVFFREPSEVASPLTDAEVENLAIQVYAENGLGNFTGGNAANTLKVTVYFVVVDL